MSIEVGSKWVKDGEVVEVIEEISDSFYSKIFMINFTIDLILTDKKCFIIKADFLEQYKPYEPVYEWQWCTKYNGNDLYEATEYYTEEEIEKHVDFEKLYIQRLDITKRERK